MGYEPTTYCVACEEPFDVYRAPGERRCEDCIDELIAEHGRAELGVDGNAGFALIGPDLQEGEAEFVCIDEAPELFDTKPLKEAWAATQAFRRLKKRMGREFSYHLGPSHPRHC